MCKNGCTEAQIPVILNIFEWWTEKGAGENDNADVLSKASGNKFGRGATVRVSYLVYFLSVGYREIRKDKLT
jgi:hypothetical protein